MSVLALWPLALLVTVPGLILLYMLKQNAKEHTIPSVTLWQEVYQNMQASTPWERLRNNLLFYIQLLLILLFVLALASPYFKSGGKVHSNLIVCIDNSGSMNGMYDDDMVKLDAAKEKAIDYISHYKGDSMVTVASANQTAQLLLSGSGDRGSIRNAIQNIESTDTAGNMETTVTLLQSVTSQLPDYEVVLFTDSDVSLGSLQATVVDLSPVTDAAGKNVSVDYVSHAVSEDMTADVLAKLTNHGSKTAEGEVNLYLDDRLLAVSGYEIEGGKSAGIYFDKISAKTVEEAMENSGILKVECNERDALWEDNVAYDFFAADESKNVLLVTDQNVFLEKSITAGSDINLYKTNSITHLEDTMKYDLYIFDGEVPEEVPEKGNLLYLNPKEDAGIGGKTIFQVEEILKNAWIDVKEHEVTNYLEDYTFGVSRLSAMKKPEWAQDFFTSGIYSAGFIGDVDGRCVAVLGFDIHKTDFPLQTEFPIFIHNLMRACLGSSVIPAKKTDAGTVLPLNLSAGEEALVIAPDASRKKISASESLYHDTKKAGLYSVTVTRENEEEIKENFSVAFPYSESAISGKITVTSDKGEKAADNGTKDIAGGMSLRIPCIILLMLLVMVEWGVYSKRT